jgi:[protein-PII] uridylyltransferase
MGRAELGPRSDLDLVLLHDGRTLSPDEVAELATALWYPIWDAGFALDHSVRSLNQSRKVASADIRAAVGLLNLRIVAGDGDLGARAASSVLADWRQTARKRLEDLVEGNTDRAERYGELAHRLEPDVKEARGGLRDATTLTALAATWITDRPHGDVDAAWDLILDVRDAIHSVTGRPSNVLSLAIQDEVAELLRFGDADDLLASLAAAGRAVAYALDVTVRRARANLSRTVIRPFIVRGRAQAPRLRPLGPGLVEHEHEIVLAAGVDVDDDATLGLRAAVTSAKLGLPIAPLTARHLARARPPGTAGSWTPEALALLVEFLATGRAQIGVWEALDQAGVVARWLPAWAAVRNRPQRNPLHRHTVDRHMIETVALAAEASAGLAPGPRRTLLLAALFHDIGKCPGERDHAKAGAGIVPGIAAALGLDAATAGDMEMLVREHLSLAQLATSRDPADPATAQALAGRLEGRADLLELLRILTEADSRAAGPKAWTAWRASLIETLTATTRALLAGAR